MVRPARILPQIQACGALASAADGRRMYSQLRIPPTQMLGRTLLGMPGQSSSERFRLWRRVAPYVRIVVLSLLPVPDPGSRCRVRRAARRIVTCKAWPGMDATGAEAAQLAILRLLWLQRETRRAVRGRHREAAIMLARASIETLILSLYCLHEPTAVAQLQAANVRTLQGMLEYLCDEDVIPADVLAECIRRLNLGQPGKAPSVEAMAQRVDKATNGAAAVALYKRFYRPTSNLAVHASAASLLRHVRSDGSLTRRPGRVWSRRSPTRIADACAGLAAGAVAYQNGAPTKHFAAYTERHLSRALTPVAVIGGAAAGRAFKPHQAIDTIRLIRETGVYIWSEQDADDPPKRTAHIRAAFKAALHIDEFEIPTGSLDPFLDYVAAKLATENAESGQEEASHRS